jgi:Flp pilus assembly protein TadG
MRNTKYHQANINARPQSGHSLIELGAISMFLSVLVIFSVDIGIMMMASSMNDRACRDAARAAAQADTYANALSLAQTALKSYTADGYFVTQPTISTTNFVYQDYAGSPPSNTSPYVSVTTSVQAKVPAPINFFNAKFGANGSYIFTQTYTFPIVRTTLYLP